MTRNILKRRGLSIALGFLFALVFGCVFSQSSYAQEGKYASYQAAAENITYEYIAPIVLGVSEGYNGAPGNAPNFYGGDIGHASSATCGMTFLMKPGYKITAENDGWDVYVYDEDDDEVAFEISDNGYYSSGGFEGTYIRATWAIISYPDGSADLVTFGNTYGHGLGPNECEGDDGNIGACGNSHEWAWTCEDLFSDEIGINENANENDIYKSFAQGSTSNLSAVGSWQPAGMYSYGCPSDHYYRSFESHAGCTKINPYVHNSLTENQKQAAAAAVTYGQQKQDEQCGGVVGFFTCPLAESISSFLKTVYDVFSGFFLNIDPAVFSGYQVGTPGYAIHKVWSSFRNIANVLLVVALLIVILSQISGFGINNYGIKKSLPKIIIAALLVNFSYIICQGAIDLSNIFGHRIGDIFEGMLDASSSKYISGSYTGSTIATLIFVLIGVIVAIIHFGSRIWVALIILLLVCAVALFIMLAVSVIRQALCILLVVVSPIALVCYMLPGTKSVYSKWFNMFKGVLVAYPMTSLVVYGSSYAATILLNAWGFSADTNISIKDMFTTFLHSMAGLLIVVGPYFFIPSIIMKSLGALNGVASRIGSAMLRNTSGAVRGSAFAQRQNDSQEFRKNLRRAGLHYNKDTGNIENRRTPGRGKNRFTRALNRAIDRHYDHPTRAMYSRNAYSMAAQRRRGRSYYTGGNELDEILKENSGDSAELKQRKAELRKKLASRRRRGRSTAGITRQVNRMFGAGGEFAAFAPQKFRDSAGNFTGVKGDAETTADNIENSENNQRTREYIKQIESEPGLTEENMSDNIIEAATSGNKELTSAYITVLLESGEMGREALYECIKTNSLPAEALEIIAGSVSTSDMNDIKKKNRYLYNRLKAIKDHGAAAAGSMNVDNNFKMTCSDVRGLSAKQFANMDVSAQNRLIDEITDPNIYGNNTGYKPEDGIVAAAVNLAEEILSDPSLRATISPERLSNLENIVRIRDDAVKASVQANRTADLSAINSTTGNTGGQKWVDSVGADFVQGITSSQLKNAYIAAAKNGDSVRMESIQLAIEAKYRDNLRNSGVNLTEDANAMMNAVLQEVYTQLNQSVENLGPNAFNGADNETKQLHADARDGFVDLLSGRMDRGRKSSRR